MYDIQKHQNFVDKINKLLNKPIYNKIYTGSQYLSDLDIPKDDIVYTFSFKKNPKYLTDDIGYVWMNADGSNKTWFITGNYDPTTGFDSDDEKCESFIDFIHKLKQCAYNYSDYKGIEENYMSMKEAKKILNKNGLIIE
mgnify:CR=1 FL=1